MAIRFPRNWGIVVSVSVPDVWGHAALHERHVDAGLRIEQQLQVLVRAGGDPLIHGHALARKQILVAPRKSVIDAAFRAGGQHDMARDRDDDELVDAPHDDRDQRRRQQRETHPLSPRDQPMIVGILVR